MMKSNRCLKVSQICLVNLFLFLVFSFSSVHAREAWYPAPVDIWDPPFNADHKTRTGTYVPLEKAQKDWRICVSIPHLKDPYWRVVNFAVISEARRLGVRVRLSEAGGYGKLDVQRKQIEQCMASGADALIASAIKTDGLNDLVERYTGQGKPVIDLINWMSSKKITARAAVDYYDNGFVIGRYLLKRHPDSSKPVRVAWFPGPDGPTWASSGDKGFREAIKNSHIKIIDSAWGDTGKSEQGKLVKASLDKHSNLDYIIGTTVSADAAVELLRRRKLNKKIKVLAYYYGPGVDRGIRRGNVIAAPTDFQAIQARIAMDLAVRALEGRDYLKHVGPRIS